jgi:AcrR family transcriptional regulator
MTEPFSQRKLMRSSKRLTSLKNREEHDRGENEMSARVQEKTAPQIAEDNVKRRQIIEGARAAFLEQGFDAASMNDIARTAGVSKGTLYVYFQNKEQLFQAICSEECEAQAETLFKVDPDDVDVEGTLTRLGVDFLRFVCRPDKASSARTVIAIAERMPDIGRAFYETGPARGIAMLSDYLKSKVEQGVLAIEDCEVAAAQLIEAFGATTFKPMLFNFGKPPTEERIRYVVSIAVRMFLTAYRVHKALD